jgi:hypothetical protein
LQQPCASRQKQTQPDSGDSHPSYIPVSKGTLELRGEFIITEKDVHLVIEDLGLSRLGLGDQRFIQNIKNILADFLKFSLDLLAVITNGRNMLVGALRLFLLLD